ncbi:MAG TPA: hypothetical protein VKP67_06745 [Xanthobacteraceae bacterium]|nr:hypothetical protein [Xanthobacteraceae bacterium]
MPPFPSLEDAQKEPPRWSYDASLLFRRMALNHVDRVEIEENDPLLFFELQGLCTLCPSKERCAHDLAKEAGDDTGWREYCPNAIAFAGLEVQQDCGLAGQHGAGCERIVVTKLGSVILRTKQADEKIYLERRAGESLFGPRQYFYAASKSGVVPTHGGG